MLSQLNTFVRGRPLFVLALYGAELLDELIYGLHSAVVPYIKTDLALTYTQVGLLFTAPGLIGIFVEPLFGLLGDTRQRKTLVVGGAAATAFGLALTALGQTYGLILLAFTVLFIASGAYVHLAQAALIDRDPARAEHTMARWVLLGAVGVMASPAVAAAAFYFGYGWRDLYGALAAAAGLYTALLLRQKFSSGAPPLRSRQPLPLGAFARALANRELLRWVLLAEMADLMLDKLLEVTGLYFHDVAGVSLAAASGATAAFTVAGLIGNALLVPALERVSGLRVLRVTAVVVLAAYAALLAVPLVWAKYALIAIVSLSTAGWYSTLRAKCFQVLPGQSGLIIAVTSLGNLSSLFVPLLIGRVADAIGLQWAMWILALGPAALIAGLPKDDGQPIDSAKRGTRSSHNRDLV